MMIKISKIILVIAICSSVAKAQFSGGDGTEASPYEIRTLEELEQVSNYPDKCFIQKANIYDSLRKPLCDVDTFSGTYNGNGYKVTLAIEKPDCNCGLFSCTESATIKNVIVDGYIITDFSHGIWNGGIVGLASFTDIYNCINLAKIYGGYAAGGIIGASRIANKVENCMNLGIITEIGIGAGGIIGWAHAIKSDKYTISNVRNCINAGFISGYDVVGGIVGFYPYFLNDYNSFFINLTNSINVGSVEIIKIPGEPIRWERGGILGAKWW